MRCARLSHARACSSRLCNPHELMFPRVCPPTPQVLRMHLLENVRLRIEAGHIDYVNEIRVCTVLFLGFPSINHLLDKLPPGGMGEAVENKVRWELRCRR